MNFVEDDDLYIAADRLLTELTRLRTPSGRCIVSVHFERDRRNGANWEANTTVGMSPDEEVRKWRNAPLIGPGERSWK